MFETLTLPIALALVGSALANISFVPYFFDIFLGKTRPHAVSWLIWSITQGVGAAALWYGGASLAALGITLTTLLVFIIFLLSLQCGTRHLRFGDTVVLVFAVVALLGWVLLDHPVWAVVLVSLVEFLGFIPTFRKAYEKPVSEHFPSWTLYCIGMVLMLVTLPSYTFLTTTYLATMTVGSLILLSILILRRRKK